MKLIGKIKKKEHFSTSNMWEHDIIGSAFQARNRAWALSFICLVLTFTSLLSLVTLMPLKTFVPYVIAVDQATGYTEVAKTLTESKITKEEIITEANLVKYVSLREQYNPYILKENYESVARLSTDNALEEYKHLWSAKNPQNPSLLLGKHSAVAVKIRSVALLNEKTASVRFLKERDDGNVTQVSYWNAIIQFKYNETPMKMIDRFINPLGFQVTHYKINPESMEHTK